MLHIYNRTFEEVIWIVRIYTVYTFILFEINCIYKLMLWTIFSIQFLGLNGSQYYRSTKNLVTIENFTSALNWMQFRLGCGVKETFNFKVVFNFDELHKTLHPSYQLVHHQTFQHSIYVNALEMLLSEWPWMTINLSELLFFGIKWKQGYHTLLLKGIFELLFFGYNYIAHYPKIVSIVHRLYQ